MASGNEDKLDGCLEVTHKFTQEDRLARPHFPREEHKPLLGFDPINQSSQSFHIDRVAIKESRVRRYAKWRLSKPKVTLNVFIQTKKFGHFLCLLYKKESFPTVFADPSVFASDFWDNQDSYEKKMFLLQVAREPTHNPFHFSLSRGNCLVNQHGYGHVCTHEGVFPPGTRGTGAETWTLAVA